MFFKADCCNYETAQQLAKKAYQSNKKEPTALAVPNAKPLLLKASNLRKFC